MTLLFLPAGAQVTFSTVASTTDLSKDDYIQIEYVVENAGRIDDIKPPNFSGFTIVQGPNESTGMSIINGNSSQYKALTFILQPLRTGKIIVSGARASVDGKAMQSNAVVINVHKGSSSVPPGNTPGATPDPVYPEDERSVDRIYLLRPKDNVDDIIKKNFFLKVDVSKSSCYVGEPITASYKLYTRLQSESQVVKQPSLNGFSVYDMNDPGTDATGVEKINGKTFVVHTIRKVQLIPLVEGQVVLDPVEVDNDIHFIKTGQKPDAGASRGLSGLFDRLFNQSSEGAPYQQQVSLTSKPVIVNVKALPVENKPADFTGAVGHYSIQAAVTGHALDTGDAAELEVKISGSGNLPVINAPLPEWPAGTESYSTHTKEDINKTTAPLGGKKTFTYSFIPSLTGTYTIPPIRFSYFDPASGTYKNIQSDPVHFSAVAGTKRKHAPALAKTAITTAGTSKYMGKHWLALVAGLLLAGALMFIVLQNKLMAKKGGPPRQTENSPSPIVESMTIPPVAEDPLAETKHLLEKGEFGKFYATLNRSIWKAVAARLEIPSSELNKLSISRHLSEEGWSPADIAQLREVLNECEIKLYTPDHNEYDMHRVLAQAEKITGKLQTV